MALSSTSIARPQVASQNGHTRKTVRRSDIGRDSFHDVQHPWIQSVIGGRDARKGSTYLGGNRPYIFCARSHAICALIAARLPRSAASAALAVPIFARIAMPCAIAAPRNIEKTTKN